MSTCIVHPTLDPLAPRPAGALDRQHQRSLELDAQQAQGLILLSVGSRGSCPFPHIHAVHRSRFDSTADFHPSSHVCMNATTSPPSHLTSHGPPTRPRRCPLAADGDFLAGALKKKEEGVSTRQFLCGDSERALLPRNKPRAPFCSSPTLVWAGLCFVLHA
ncbi:uncharacterized protein BKA78DRAFT_321434 [Phyllosticta capitalensis]|uniref:uncharacterized protein n=1 Tax=Phyllosticta capitalensis TaxID=121624 RepID=UPI00312DD13A